MSLDRYKQWKQRYETTKPIRGRTVECRPWGSNRSRDWEEIVRVLTPFGESYGARLYQTDCVVVAPNGDLFIKTGGWATPLTAEWIEMRSQLRCYKKYNEVWLDVDGRSIPLDRDKHTHLKWNEETRKYTCDKVVKMEQKVVDKTKIKEVRNSVKEFKTFVKVMMKLADGWISHELTSMHRVKDDSSAWNRYNYWLMGEKFDQYQVRGDRMYADTAKRLLKCMQEVEADEDKVKLMLILAEGVGCESSRIVSSEEVEREYNGSIYKSVNEVREYQYKPDSIVRRIDYLIKKGSDVFTTKEVEVTRPMTNLM